MPKSTSNGVDIWYEITGDGPALVLVHANPFDHDLWLYQAAHFSTWFKVVSVDIRGYGRSAKITTPYTEEDMCDDVMGVLGDLGIEKAVLGG
ncbi:MAG: alpha/beta hydrolase, partial [Alphaproteobacteria bacterium]|nr:alpha/beta hydrolase [Alphaproteobacteria bacterium]